MSIEILQNNEVLTQEDMSNATNDYKMQLRQSQEVQDLNATLNFQDVTSLMKFGESASNGISTLSTRILSGFKKSEDDIGLPLIKQLDKLIQSFDIDEIKLLAEPPKRGLAKIFSKAKASIDALLARYQTFGGEVDKIQVELKKFEIELNKSNQQLEELDNANFNFYMDLERHIVSGELALEELDTKYLPAMLSEVESTGDALKQQQYENILEARNILEQRVYDLRLSENMSLQTIPMLRMIRHNNLQLSRKINTSFVITLPIFKNCLIQLITLKKQQEMTKAFNEMDKTTNALIAKSAQMTATGSVKLAEMNGKGAISIETLQESWNTIKNGIEETNRIMKENAQARIENTKTLEKMKEEAR